MPDERLIELVPVEQQLAYYEANPGAAERAMRKRHRLNGRSIQLQRLQRRASPDAPTAPVVVTPRGASRPRERREARHRARSTSSGDSGSDDGSSSPAAAPRGLAA